jgi:hypothetical protein
VPARLVIQAGNASVFIITFSYLNLKKVKFMTAVILAGGKSSRMGYNKAFLKLKGKTFIERQIHHQSMSI